jgi:protoporphyrinogen oxidase
VEALELSRSGITRRELLTYVLGAPLAAAACRRMETSTFSGRLLGTSDRMGHRLIRCEPSVGGGVKQVDVAIVGGGIAGLSAGWRLARAGLQDFVVLEVEPQLGGTSASGRSAITGYPWAAHYIVTPPVENRSLVELLNEMGAIESVREDGTILWSEDLLCNAPQERLFYQGRWYEGLYPLPGASREDQRQLDAFHHAMNRWAGKRDAQGRRAFGTPICTSSDDPTFTDLDRQSMAQYLDAHGWSSPRLRWYVDYACRDDYGLRLEETSAWAGIFYYASRIARPGEKPAEFLVWPQGNGRAVEHFASMLGERARTGVLATEIVPASDGCDVHCVQASGEPITYRARQVICATPAFVTKYLVASYRAEFPAHLQSFHYTPWVTANLTLRDRPASSGYPLCWDNVLYDSASLGYVDATHQSQRDRGPTVWTWYLPLCGPDPKANRRMALLADWEHWRDVILADLRRAHEGLDEVIDSMDVWRWGHAMVRPEVGFVWGGAPQQARRALGAIHFAQTELSGMTLFEEAHDHGVRAAEEVLSQLGVEFESARKP